MTNAIVSPLAKVDRQPEISTRPEFLQLLADANAAWANLEALTPEHPSYATTLAQWTKACMRLVTNISNRSEAEALDGLDGRSADDWVRFLLSLGPTQD